MEHSVRFQALVLRHNNYGEADRFITLLTARNGKISALAKGVRKLNSRKAGHLQPFTYVTIQLSKGRGASWLVDQVSTIEAFPQIIDSLEKTVRASCITELADRFSLEDVENSALFQLTLETIRRIAAADDFFPAQRYFDLYLLDCCGYRPQLQHCVSCGKAILPEDQYFSYALGGVLCPACGYLHPAARPVSVRVLKYLRYYQGHSFQEAAAAGWPPDIRGETESILTGYQSYLLERKTNSQQFLETMRSSDSH